MKGNLDKMAANKVVVLAKRIDALSRREKLILLATAVTASLLVVMEFFVLPGWQQRQAMASNLVVAGELNQSLLVQRDMLEAGLSKDTNAVLRAENQQLALQLAAKRQQLKDSLSALVTPDDMPVLLTELLQAIPELEIKEVVKLPSIKIQQGEGEGAAVLYSHRIRIVVAGAYFDALRYVRQIEAESDQLRLVTLDYKVEKYPSASMILEVETLGLEAGWLGV